MAVVVVVVLVVWVRAACTHQLVGLIEHSFHSPWVILGWRSRVYAALPHSPRRQARCVLAVLLLAVQHGPRMERRP